MKIGIIGSGNMGRAIGVRLAELGHLVFLGARRPEQAAAAAVLAGGAPYGNNDEAARFGEVLVWTMRNTDPASVLSEPSLLNGKVVLDLNNRDFATEARHGVSFDNAIAERLQTAAPSARVVKALNTVAMETFDTKPDALRSAGAQTFLAGRDPSAKGIVGGLVQSLGFEPIDLGTGPAAFRAAEALGDIIRILMIDGHRGGRAHLKLITLPRPDLASVGQREPSAYA